MFWKVWELLWMTLARFTFSGLEVKEQTLDLLWIRAGNCYAIYFNFRHLGIVSLHGGKYKTY